MKKLGGYFLMATGAFVLGSLIKKVRLKVLHTGEAKAMEIKAREKQILAAQEKVKQKEDEMKKYKKLADEISELTIGESVDEDRLNEILTKFMEDNNIPKPWGDRDFDEFMRDPDSKLKFI